MALDSGTARLNLTYWTAGTYRAQTGTPWPTNRAGPVPTPWVLADRAASIRGRSPGGSATGRARDRSGRDPAVGVRRLGRSEIWGRLEI
jgi:hypothetical protein